MGDVRPCIYIVHRAKITCAKNGSSTSFFLKAIYGNQFFFLKF